MTLGQRIQELRKQASLSQEALGEALGVSRQAVSKWEGDNGIPELDTLIAMSRLFNVTVGQLLGVEEPAPAEAEPTPAIDEEKVEAILRRYVDESRQHMPKPTRTRWEWFAAAACLLAVLVIVLFAQIGDVKHSVSNLRGNLSSMESIVSNVRNQVGGLSDELRDVIEEQGNLHSTFSFNVESFDIEEEMVDVTFCTTLKSCTADSKVQFVLNWIEVDRTEGSLTTDPADGPEFKATVTIPMNFHLDVSIRVLEPDGSIREQRLDTIYSGMHPDNFRVHTGSAGVNISSDHNGITQFGYKVDIHTDWPELIYPVKAYTVIYVDGAEYLRQEEPFSALEIIDNGLFGFSGEINFDTSIEEDRVEFRILLVDNYGRITEERLF